MVEVWASFLAETEIPAVPLEESFSLAAVSMISLKFVGALRPLVSSRSLRYQSIITFGSSGSATR